MRNKIAHNRIKNQKLLVKINNLLVNNHKPNKESKVKKDYNYKKIDKIRNLRMNSNSRHPHSLNFNTNRHNSSFNLLEMTNSSGEMKLKCQSNNFQIN